MKIRITAGGIYGANGEVPIGTEVEVGSVPAGWAGRYEIVADDPKSEAKPITNPALDHDGDGRPGGSKSGGESTAAKGAAKRRKKKGR